MENMECYSQLAMLKYNGEIETADEPRRIVGATVDREADMIIVTYPHVVQQIKLKKEAPWTEVCMEWRTKYNLTSGVVYDSHGDSYVAVCGCDTVRVAKTVAQLDSADKYTFQKPIYKILTRTNKTPLIIFRNGDCLTLPYGLEKCKTFHRKALIKEASSIVEAAAYTRDDKDYVCFIENDKNNNYSVVNYPLKDEACDYQKVKTVKVSEARDCTQSEVLVKGCCIVAGASDNPSIFFTWSDAYVGIYDVVKNSWKVKLYHLSMQTQYKSTLVCLKRNLVLCYGRAYKYYDDKESYSSIAILHKTLPERWSYGSMRLTPYSSNTQAYDCDEHVVLVELTRVTVWSITVTATERLPCWLNDSERLMRHLRPKEILPIFGNRRKHENRKSKKS